MDDTNLRGQALSEAIRIQPNNEAGDSSRVVADAKAFYSFLTGEEKSEITITSNVDPLTVAKYIEAMRKRDEETDV